jgi:hypothetical protein
MLTFSGVFFRPSPVFSFQFSAFWTNCAVFKPMSTLTEIEAAADALPPKEKTELIRFLAERLRPMAEPTHKARLVKGPGETLLLEASPDAPPMTTKTVKRMLEDFL